MLDKYDVCTLKDKDYIVLAKENCFDKVYYFLSVIENDEDIKEEFEIMYEYEDGLLIEEDQEMYNKVKEKLLKLIETDISNEK